MLKKRFRLRKKEDFERVFRQGKPLFFGSIGCRIARNDLGYLRIGFSFGKKYLKTAVGRNALRRQLMGRFLLTEGEIVKYPYDVVIFLLKPPLPGNHPSFASVAENIVEYVSK